MYDPVDNSWTDFSNAASGVAASPRDSHGFTSVLGKLYIHGGEVGNGKYVQNHKLEPYIEKQLSTMNKFYSNLSFRSL